MKKIFLALFTVAVINSFCFAEEMPEVMRVASKLEETQVFTGTIKEILLNNNPMYGNRSEIIVVDNKGQKMTFIVRTGIAVFSSSGSEKTYTLKALRKGDMVTIEYVTNKEGLHRVMTIELTRWGM
jgi:hypothetical protein